MPAIIVLDDQTTFITDPVNPCAGEEFIVSWGERNVGDEDSSEYQDIFDLDDEGTGDSKALQCKSLAAGASSTQSLSFILSSGNFRMTLILDRQDQLDFENIIIDDC